MTSTEEHQSVVGPHRYRHAEKMIRTANPVWQAAADHGLTGIRVDTPSGDSNNRLVDRATGHEFVNMCSCAYLGLNHHPAVIEGAVSALREAGTTWLVTSTTRIRHQLLARLEEELGELFGAQILPGTTCSALTAGILPLIASGHLAPGGPRVMVFDRHCHFCMSYVKPICAEESLVLTCDHNDLNYLEDVCRRYPSVAYVADGAYSMGGAAALDGLLELQDRYGLFLFIDDSHSLSLVGERGEGFVRSRLAMNPLTVIVTSLGKGFGTGGGVAMLGDAAMSRFWPGTPDRWDGRRTWPCRWLGPRWRAPPSTAHPSWVSCSADCTRTWRTSTNCCPPPWPATDCRYVESPWVTPTARSGSPRSCTGGASTVRRCSFRPCRRARPGCGS